MSSASTAELGHRHTLFIEQLVTRLLAEDEARAREVMEEEVDDGLRVLYDHRAPHDDVSKVEHLAKEVPQVRTAADNLAVNESVELAVIVPLIGMTEGMRGNLGDVFGVTHPIEVKYYEWFVSGLKSSGQGVAIYLRGIL